MNGIVNNDCINTFPFKRIEMSRWNEELSEYQNFLSTAGVDWVIRPIIFGPGDYFLGDKFQLKFFYNWDKYPDIAKDVTVKVYSDMKDLKLTDSDGNTNEIHMDDISNFHGEPNYRASSLLDLYHHSASLDYFF